LPFRLFKNTRDRRERRNGPGSGIDLLAVGFFSVGFSRLPTNRVPPNNPAPVTLMPLCRCAALTARIESDGGYDLYPPRGYDLCPHRVQIVPLGGYVL
jgi:hypothetical protein